MSAFRIFSTIGLAIAAAMAWVQSGQAENLHLKHGSSWDCSLLAVETDAGFRLYQACKACELKKQQFYQTRADGGRCVRIGVSSIEPAQPARPARPAPSTRPHRDNAIIDRSDGSGTRPNSRPNTTPDRASIEPTRSVKWGAISVRLQGRNGWSQGSAWNYKNRAEARRRSMRGCRKHGGGCKVLVTFKTCGAISFGWNRRRSGAYGSFGVNARNARSKALSRCRQKYGNCKIIVHKCNS